MTSGRTVTAKKIGARASPSSRLTRKLASQPITNQTSITIRPIQNHSLR
jgi:hypothetical protein